MPFIRVTTNATRLAQRQHGDDVSVLVKAISDKVIETIKCNPHSVFIDLDLGKKLFFGGSTELCAFVDIRNIGNIDVVHNPSTVAGITDILSTQLGIAPARVFIGLQDASPTNVGLFGKLAAHLAADH